MQASLYHKYFVFINLHFALTWYGFFYIHFPIKWSNYMRHVTTKWSRWHEKNMRHDKLQILSKVFNPADVYSFKVNNGNTRTMCEICSDLTIRHQNDVIEVLLVLLLLTLNGFHILFWCFHYLLWTNKCRMERRYLD